MPTPKKAAQAAFFALSAAILLLATSACCSTALAQVPTPAHSAPAYSVNSAALPVTALGALLGLDESGLLQAVPDLRKTARPVPGPRGSRGLWALPEQVVGGLPLETLFFFRARKLERIEQRTQPLSAPCSRQFDQLTTALETQLGSAVRSTELTPNSNRSAAWSLEAYRLTAFQTQAIGTCTVMLVHEPLSTKDASVL